MQTIFCFIKECLKGVFMASGLLVLIIVVSNVLVYSASREGMATAETTQKAPVVIVLGASVKSNGQPSGVLEDRLVTALGLYETEKVDKFLLSGDNGQRDYDEVNAMKAYLLKKGVPAEDIFLDHAGFDSYDSLYRAKYIFGAERVIIVTQKFHLPRVLYIAQSLDIKAYGVPADIHEYVKINTFQARELLANVKAVFDVTFKSKPTYLGESVSLQGDGQITWDEE